MLGFICFKHYKLVGFYKLVIHKLKFIVTGSLAYYKRLQFFFAIELITLAVNSVPLAVEFGAFAVEFFALALQFVALAIELDAFAKGLGAFALELV